MCGQVNACLCACAHLHSPAGVVQQQLAVEGASRSLCKDVSFQPHLARAHFAASSSLARTQTATWPPQLVEDGAAGLLVGAGRPLPSQECLAISSGCQSSLGGTSES